MNQYPAPLPVSGPRNDFIHSETDEPHASRRKIILAKYPEIEKLFGSDSRPVPFVLAIILSQLFLAYYQKNFSLPVYFLVAWIYGGAANHALSLMTHELSHNLVFQTKELNEYFGIFCNIAMGVPSSTMFKRYHMEHHQFQGDTIRDTDIPTSIEGKIFRSTPMKCIWLLLQPLFYALRPTLTRPKKPQPLDILNTVVIVVTDAILLFLLGPRGLLYLIFSTLLGMGFHPVAGHFISEHYVFDNTTQETYSYYGSLNLICWNVGYHNEHHDFPRVPGWRLPEVRRIAPEFYNTLPHYQSWTGVLWRFLTDPNITPYSRVIRNPMKAE